MGKKDYKRKSRAIVDTYDAMNWYTFKGLVAQHGFEPVHSYEFHIIEGKEPKLEERVEEGVIWADYESGFLLRADSRQVRKNKNLIRRMNSGSLYFQISLPQEWKKMRPLDQEIIRKGLSLGSYVGVTNKSTKEHALIIHQYARFSLITYLRQIESFCQGYSHELNTTWINIDTNLVTILDYGEIQENFLKTIDINLAKLNWLPRKTKEMLGLTSKK